MLGILYLILASVLGHYFFKKLVPDPAKICKISSLTGIPGKSIKLPSWMISLPGAFLIGTLVVAWFTYLSTWSINHFLPQLAKPLLYGNLLTFLGLIVFLVFIFAKKSNREAWIKPFKTFNIDEFIAQHKVELAYILLVTVVWSIFMVRSFYVSQGTMYVGYSVSSDFGNTLSIVRSFSLGSNFPTEFTHFAGVATGGANDIRYHFMFQFLAGNLEFLGTRIDWAFNLPSILAMVSFLMLLYSLTVMIIGKRWCGFMVFGLFFLRSSFAFFTYLAKLIAQGTGSIPQLMNSIIHNTGYIGNTECESWGFWMARVYVNKRHFAFALGIGVLVIILLLPLFKKMIQALKKLRTTYQETKSKSADSVATVNPIEAVNPEEAVNAVETISATEPITGQKPRESFIKLWFREFFLKGDAWRAENTGRALMLGLILGLIGFWNGAVALTVLPVLFLMAIFSKHRMSYVFTALVAVPLIFLQTLFFMGQSNSTGQIGIYIGFLAAQKDLWGISRYYIELLGILPFLLIAVFGLAPKGIRWLTLAFLAPLIMATTMKFTVDVGANHVIIIFAVILLDISITYLLFRLFQKGSILESLEIIILGAIYFAKSAQLFGFTNLVFPTLIGAIVLLLAVFLLNWVKNKNSLPRVISVFTAVLLISLLVATGVVDTITLANEDRGVVGFPMNDPELQWIVKNTGPNDIFLISPTYQHTVFLAGRKVFLGGAYIAWSSGYDFNGRMWEARRIFASQTAEELKALMNQYKIKYVLIDDETRNSPDLNSSDFKLNETLFRNTFPCVYDDPGRRTQIYRIQ